MKLINTHFNRTRLKKLRLSRPEFRVITRNEGFTILELLVSVGIIAGISIVVAQVLFTTSKTNTKSEVSKDVKQSGEYVLQVLERQIRNARDVTSACSAIGETTTTLALTNSDESTTTIGCAEVDPIFRMVQTTSGIPTYLTSGDVTLGSCADTSIKFICVESPGVPKSVITSFSLAQSGTSPNLYEQSNATFESTITLRNR